MSFLMKFQLNHLPIFIFQKFSYFDAGSGDSDLYTDLKYGIKNENDDEDENESEDNIEIQTDIRL
jgi:hypothetical protein